MFFLNEIVFHADHVPLLFSGMVQHYFTLETMKRRQAKKGSQKVTALAGWGHMRSRCSPRLRIVHCACTRLRSTDLATSDTGILWALDTGLP